MKSISLIITIILSGFLGNLIAQSESENFFINVNQFFKKNVTRGKIDYENLKNNPAELNQLVDDISKIDYTQLKSGNEEKAFLLNVYNILVIKLVIKNYPLKSVMDIGGFFDKDIINFNGQDVSLNEIEKNILFKKFPDPRLHFVLVCAAIGCPEIINSAYLPMNLDDILDKRTKITLNNEHYIKINKKTKTVYISELFKWYKNDFIMEDISVIQYINFYRNLKIPEDYKVDYITYDWSLNTTDKKESGSIVPRHNNLQVYTPSTLLKPGQIEVKLFNNLYTQTELFDDQRKKKAQNSRSTYFTGIINSLYGINNDINIGIDFYFKSVRNDTEDSLPFSLFKFSSNENSRSALAQLGPKIKISPFKSYRNIAFQSTFLIPVTSDLDGSESTTSPYLDVDGMQWWTQIFYDYSLNNDFLLYLESGIFVRFDSPFEDFYMPLKAFVNYYPSRDWTIYFPAEFTSYWKEVSISAFYTQLGLGGKYQLTSNFELEILLTKFVFGKSQGAGTTYNLGVRFIM